MEKKLKAYNLHNIFIFHIEHGKLGKSLSKLLREFRVESPGKDSIAIHVGSFPKEQTDHFVGKKYKMVPWQVGLKFENDKLKKIFFNSLAFNSFLFYRLIIIPYLMKEIVKQNGFYLLGSAFQLNDKDSFFLFAKPGTGKTRAMLSLFDSGLHGLKLIGDGSFIIDRSKSLTPILSEIELRYKTVKFFNFIKNLNLKQKNMLRLFHLLSFVTMRKISFNISINIKQFGFNYINDSENADHHFILIDNNVDQIKDITGQQVNLLINDYLNQYFTSYDYIFPEKINQEALNQNINNFIESLKSIQTCSIHNLINIVEDKSNT